MFLVNFNFIGNANETDPYKKDFENIFNIGKMLSHDKKFTLFFKSREKAILAKGENCTPVYAGARLSGFWTVRFAYFSAHCSRPVRGHLFGLPV